MKRNLSSFILAIVISLSGCKTPVPTISNSYKESIREDIKVDIPEVYEAMQIALSLTDTYQSDPNLIKKDTPYYEEMMRHFSEHKDHPLIAKLDKKLRKAGAYNEINTLIRFQALNYSLKGGRIVKENRYNIPFIYNVAPYPLFLYHNNRQLINSFLKESDFAGFYSRHKKQYDSLINRSHELNDYSGMKKWLEREFPHVRNEAFLIVFSPLTGGLHNIKEFSSKSRDKKQSILFVNAPDYERGIWENRPLAEKSAYASRFVFTEIDHSYVNPTTAPYIGQIEAAMQELKDWKAEKVTGGYNSYSLTFNEYMTWAVFTLYAYDTYHSDVFERVIESQVKFMVNNRGFTKFREFNNALLSLYLKKKDGQTVADLYPDIINWMDSNKVSPQNKVQP
jgi:hypothetical protein